MAARSSPLTGIRRLGRDDLDFVDRQKLREGWAFSREQFEVYLEHDPDGCYVAVAGPRPVGMVTTTCFGPSGWVGNLIVEPDFRSRGVGRALMERALEYLEGEGAATVRLEADPPGIPLYRALGFADEFESCRLALSSSDSGPGLDGAAAQSMLPADLDEVADLDFEIVGPNRRRFLELKLSVAGIALVRRRDGNIVASLLASPTNRGVRIGPCVAREVADARSLIAAAVVAASRRPVFVGLPARNAEGLEMLARMDFERSASSLRMRRGPPLDAGEPTRVFAIASGAAG